jgi:ribose transport system substrate-binding protein
MARRKWAAALAVAALAVTAGCGSDDDDNGGGGAGGGGGDAGPKPAALDLGVYCDDACQEALALEADPASIDCEAALINTTTSNPYGADILRIGEESEKYFPNMDLKVFDGNNDPATQTSQMDTVVSQGIKTVILNPVVSDALAPAVERAQAQGVKVVLIDRTVPVDVVSTIKAPDRPLAGAAMKRIAEQLDGKGTVAILAGLSGASVTNERSKGFAEELKKHPGIKVVATEAGDYDTDKGFTATQNILTRFPEGELDYIFSMADVMSFGAIKALEAAGRDDDVKIVSIDGQNQGIDAVAEGKMDATVAYPLAMPAGLAGAAKVCAGESLPKNVALSYPVITKENVSTYRGTNFG